jgi:hypothetical protein
MALNKIIYWNCAGGIKSKHDYIKQLIKEENPCILFISESELGAYDLEIVKIKDYDLITVSTLAAGRARMACYIKSDINYKGGPQGSHSLIQ